MRPQDTPDERWLPIPEFPQYMVSTRGRVWGSFRKRIRKTLIRTKGKPYTYISFWSGERVVKRNTHQLVMAAFVGPCPPRHEIDHIDGNGGNNCLSNLEYVTKQTNQQRTWAPERRVRPCGERNNAARLTEAIVREIRDSPYHRGLCNEYAHRFGISPKTVSDIRLRKRWKHIP